MPNTWPFGLTDEPLFSGFQETPANNVVKTEMDAGPASIRRYQSTGSKIYQVQFNKSTSDVASFETFYATTLLDGSDTFEWNDPRTGTNYNWQFAEPPIITNLGGGYYRLVCALERLTAA